MNLFHLISSDFIWFHPISSDFYNLILPTSVHFQKPQRTNCARPWCSSSTCSFGSSNRYPLVALWRRPKPGWLGGPMGSQSCQVFKSYLLLKTIVCLLFATLMSVSWDQIDHFDLFWCLGTDCGVKKRCCSLHCNARFGAFSSSSPETFLL